jgi:hypothetical protein
MRDATVWSADGKTKLRLVEDVAGEIHFETVRRHDDTEVYTSGRVPRERFKRFLAEAGLL